MSFITFYCPHCESPFIVLDNEVNCAIVRHFVFFNGAQLNQHATREECNRVIEEKLGYGCAKPVCLVRTENGWSAEKCDYK